MQEGSEIFITEEDTGARLKETAAARKAEAEQLAQRMRQQLQVRLVKALILSIAGCTSHSDDLM